MPATVTVERQFLNLVLAMRQAQRQFFDKKEAHRKESHLKTAKELERQVDAYLLQFNIAIDRTEAYRMQFGTAERKD